MSLKQRLAKIKKSIRPPQRIVIVVHDDGRVTMEGESLTPYEAKQAMKQPGAVILRVVREDGKKKPRSLED